MSDKFVLKVPSNMEDITLEQYQKYLRITKDLDKESDKSNEFLGIKMIEIFCEESYDNIRRLPAAIYEFTIEQIIKCLNESTPVEKSFIMRGNDGAEIEFGMIPNLDNMSSGEYIDLDDTITDFDTMHKAMAVLYRPIIKRHKDLYDIEPYSTYEKYEDIMKHAPLNISLGAMVFFLSFRAKIIETYPELFSTKSDGGRTYASREESFGQKWGWYQSIYAIAGGDLLKFNEVTTTRIHACLMWLAFEKDKNDLEAKRIKEAYR
jgi:hypothetical protein